MAWRASRRLPKIARPKQTASSSWGRVSKTCTPKRIDEDYRAGIFKQSMGARNRVGGCRGQPGPGTPPAAAGAGLAKPTHQRE
jgi:hypothetical protein